MAKQAPSLNKLACLFGGLWLFCQCQTADTPDIPRLFANVGQLGWQRKDGRLWLNNRPFSGWQYALSATGDTTFMGAFSEGKAEGLHQSWYANELPKEIRQYKNGWQEGEQRGWFESGKPAFVYHFVNDVYEGNLKEWLPGGRLIHDGNYQKGQEEGRQRQWFADGSLKMNYVVRKGRTYGFTGVKNCVNVWDSIAVSP